LSGFVEGCEKKNRFMLKLILTTCERFEVYKENKNSNLKASFYNLNIESHPIRKKLMIKRTSSHFNKMFF
jgi:glutamyl-tRNA reductase